MTTQNLLVELFVEELPPKALKKLGEAFAGTPEGRRELFDNIIAQQLMVDEAKKEGIENDATFKERFEDIKKRLMVEIYIKKTLADKVKNDPRLPFGLPGVNKKDKVSNGN